MTDDWHKKLTITEIFFSIQGESYLSGMPCVFVRLTGCHQRCTYCDTEYAFFGGEKKTFEEIFLEVKRYNCSNILVTGGEPLLQENVSLFCQKLLEQGFQVAIETSGNRSLVGLPSQLIKIMDLKTPGSGEDHRNNFENLKYLSKNDEIKFVVTDEGDITWSLEKIRSLKLTELCHVSLSPTDTKLLPRMADAILESSLPIRLQHQLHKFIWPEKDQGY